MKNTITKALKWRSNLAIIAIIAVIGFSFITCDDDGNGGGNGGGGSNGQWRIREYKLYDSDGSLSSEYVYNWITYRYTSDTNYEQIYTVNKTSYGAATTNSASTYHQTRNGPNYTSTYEGTSETYSSTQTETIVYDSASGLTLQSTSTMTINYSSGTTITTSSEYSYNIQLLSESGGVKTYKSSYSSRLYNGTSMDISNQAYTENKIQNGRTLETKTYYGDGTLYSTTTYTLSDNAVIKAKLGNYTLYSYNYPSMPEMNLYTTVEVLSDSAAELVISAKTFTNNVLSNQTDYTYEKVNK